MIGSQALAGPQHGPQHAALLLQPAAGGQGNSAADAYDDARIGVSLADISPQLQHWQQAQATDHASPARP